jgi:hypothetical protein
MIQFHLEAQDKQTSLYVAEDITASSPYWFAYVSFAQADPAPDTVTLEYIWNNMVMAQSAKSPGDFIFCCTAPTDPLSFMTNLEAYLSDCRGVYSIGYYVWVDAVNASFANGEGIQSMLSYGLSPSPQVLSNKGANNQINFENIYLGIPSTVGISLDADNDTFLFSSQFDCQPSVPQPGNCMYLHAQAGDSYMYGIEKTVAMPLSGSTAFTLRFPFTMLVNGGSLQNDFNTLDVSLKYFFYRTNAEGQATTMQNSYPAFGLPADGSTSVAFNVSLDPLYPMVIDRTYFLFPVTPAFISGFTTDMGREIITSADGVTAMLVFMEEKIWSYITGKQESAYYMAPVGHFYLGLPEGDTTLAPKLMCGISATESVGFIPAGNGYQGDSLVFYHNQNAYAPIFPLPTNNGTKSPIEVTELLNNTYMTSWANVLTTLTTPEKNNFYYSQPPSSSLYAAGSTAQSSSFLWFFEPPSRDLSSSGPDFCFPIVPYSTIMPSADPDNFSDIDIYQFENQILFSTRKHLVSASAVTNLQRKASKALLAGEEDTTTTIATTPQGLLATVGSQGEYLTVQLARNTDQGINYTLQLENVTSQMTDALQTNQLFLVATSGTNIGTLWSSPQTQPKGPGFENFMSIEEWPFVLNVGQGCSYGNYANVLLFKFCPGKVVDLVTHPEQWTQPGDFINSGEIQAATGWLQTYINDSITQYELGLAQGGTNFYENFYNIINDPNWNGILCLKVDVSLTSFPKELQGLLAGIDLSKFYAHHFGININQITGAGGLQMQPCSSMFGLIDYEDPAYVKQQKQDPGCKAPVKPQAGQVYDFKVLKLEVLFKNTTVADFSSIVQVTMNNLFGDSVTLPDSGGYPSYNSVVLNGTYQDYDNTPVYVFDSEGENPFMTGGNTLTEVEVVKVQFNTLINQPDEDVNMVNSRFAIWGYLHFAPLSNSMDVFSYGDDGDAAPGKGLNFANLYIDMSFDVRTPSAKNMLFDPAQITFDAQQSSYRANSLCAMFPLTITGFVTGDSENTPATMNYLKVNLPQVTSSPLANYWNGLVFKFNLGTPGALASSAGFSSSFLMAWGPASTGTSAYKVSIGIQLPGTAGIGNMMSIEGVLKLAIDTIQLNYATATDTSSAGYLLMLNKIALKFLGILQLPPGSTNCYIFGSPGAAGQANDLAWYAVYVGPNGPTGTGNSTTQKQLT